MQTALAAAPAVVLYKQYAVRFGLSYREQARTDVAVTGHPEPVRLHVATPAGTLGY